MVEASLVPKSGKCTSMTLDANSPEWGGGKLLCVCGVLSEEIEGHLVKEQRYTRV